MSKNIIRRTRINRIMTVTIVLILALVTLIPSAVNAQAVAGTIKPNWYSAVSPNGGINEWVYTGQASSTTRQVVSTWAALQTALDAVGAYNSSATNGDEQPHVIYISANIDMASSGAYTIDNKNIILRKYDTATRQWNYDNNWVNITGNVPELFDNISDIHIYNTGGVRHFNVRGTVKFVLENVTLDGRSNWTHNGTTVTNPNGRTGGGIGLASGTPNLTFAGNIVDCYWPSGYDAFGGAIGLKTETSGVVLNIFGGVLSHNHTGSGGAVQVGTNDNGNVTATVVFSKYTIFEKNRAEFEGGAIYYGGTALTVRDNVIMRNNTSNGGGAIYCRNSGTLAISDNVKIINNKSIFTSNTYNAPYYPGMGGGIYLSNYAYDTVTSAPMVATISDSVLIDGNTADRGGGGIAVGNGSNTGLGNPLTLNLNGGAISNNTASGIMREIAGGAKPTERAAIGGGGGIFAFDPNNIKVPRTGSYTTFSGNDAPFVGLTALTPPNYLTPTAHRAVFVNDIDYDEHIEQPARYQGNNNSAKFSAPYNNLYNNFDIGVSNNSATAYGKIKINRTVGGTVNRTGAFQDVFPNHDWLGLRVSDPTGATITAVPEHGYTFTGWTATSSCMPNTEINAAFSANVAPSTSAATLTIKANSMPAADITLTATFVKIPLAKLTGFGSKNMQTSINAGTYTPPSSSFSLYNAGEPSQTATAVSIGLTNFRRNGEAWTGSPPITVTGSPQSIAYHATNTGISVNGAAGLTLPGNYTATMTLTYNNGVDIITETAQVSFALIDPNTPLLVVSSHDFGTTIGSNYDVWNSATSGNHIGRQTIEVENLSALAAVMTARITGVNADDFILTGSSATIPLGDTNRDYTIEPKTGLAPGVYQAEIRISYRNALDPPESADVLSSVAMVSFTVLRPGQVAADPNIYAFGRVNPGYSLADTPAMKQIMLKNAGEVTTNITGITKTGGGASTTFNIIEGVTAMPGGSSNNSYSIQPKSGLATGEYAESFTLSYTYPDDDGVNIPGTTTFIATFSVRSAGNIKVFVNTSLDGELWGGHGKVIELRGSSNYPTSNPVTDVPSMVYFQPVTAETYDIFVDGVDSNVNVTVPTNSDATASLDFYSVSELYHDYDSLNTLKVDTTAAVIKNGTYAPVSTSGGSLADFNSSALGSGAKAYGYYGYRKLGQGDITTGSYPSVTPIPPITGITSPQKVTLYFATSDLTVTSIPAGGSTITAPSGGSGNYAYGSTVNLGVTPTNGYAFKQWEYVTGPAGLDIGIIDNSASASTFYKAPKGAVTLKANLYESGETGTGNASIWASGFNLTVSELATFDDTIAKAKAEVIATDVAGADAYSAVTADITQIDAIKVGIPGESYQLKFTNPLSPDPDIDATVTVKIYEDGEVGLYPNELANIYASGFTLTKSEAVALDANAAKAKAGLIATGADGLDAYADVVVDPTQLGAINTGEAGYSYKLKFTNPTSPELTATVTVKIYEDGETGAPGANEKSKILADGFKITKTQAELLNENSAKVLAGIIATDATGADAYSAVTADVPNLNAIIAGEARKSYPLTFTNPTTPPLTAAVTVKIYDDGETGIFPNEQASIFANGFNLVTSELAAFDEAAAKIKADLIATDVDGTNAFTSVTASAVQIAAIKTGKAGESYTLEFTNPVVPALSATVTVKIHENGETGPKPGPNELASIYASSFTIKKTQMAGLTEISAKVLAKLTAADATGGDAYSTVTADSAQLNTIKTGKAGQNYPLTFTNPVSPALNVTITVMTYEDGGTGELPGPGPGTGPDSPNAKASIWANGFNITETEASVLTAAVAKTSAVVIATDIAGDDAYSSVSVDGAQLNAIISGKAGYNYKLTFTNPISPALTATITVKIYEDGEKGTAVNDKASIFANGFTITESDTAVVTADVAKTKSALVATDVSGADAVASVTVDASQLAAIKAGKVGESYSLTFTNPVSPALTATVIVKIVKNVLDPGGDEDGDGLTNKDEEDRGTDPENPDSDGDGFPDGWEVDNGYDPLNPNDPDPNGDDDGDGVSNLDEFKNGTNPKVADIFEIIEHFGTYKGSGTISAKVDHAHNKFVKLRYDGGEIDSSNYEITEGSTVITLSEKHLATYTAGEHNTFEVQYTDGKSKPIHMKILPDDVDKGDVDKGDVDNDDDDKGGVGKGDIDKTGVAKTGDDYNLMLWISLIFASMLIIMMIMVIVSRRRSENHASPESASSVQVKEVAQVKPVEQVKASPAVAMPKSRTNAEEFENRFNRMWDEISG